LANIPNTAIKKSTSPIGTVNPSLRSSVSRRGQDRGIPAEENQRALDRISYLGGVLIPLPIISGILSMANDYGPDGSKFYVFWAIAIPLALLTVMVIYADTLRTAEVWVETPVDRVVPTHDDSSNSSKETLRPVDGEVKRSKTVAWRRHEEQVSPSARPEDVGFAFGHDVEERVIDMPMAAATAAAAVQPSDDEVRDTVLDFLPGPVRWETGIVSVPMIILEHPTDGSKPRAWKRQELGWYGAIRAIVYKRPRHGKDIPMGVAACEKGRRPKAKSY
jgi:hypothetical protein